MFRSMYLLLLLSCPQLVFAEAEPWRPNWLVDGEVVVADGAWGVPKSQALAVGSKHAIAGTSAPFAIRAGLDALKQGGSAADAAIS